MKTKIVIGLLAIAVILAWTGMAGAQTATPGPMVTLPGGEAMWSLEGKWEAVNENYGVWAKFWTYPNTRVGSSTSVWLMALEYHG